jgi:hypothetical protein
VPGGGTGGGGYGGGGGGGTPLRSSSLSAYNPSTPLASDPTNAASASASGKRKGSEYDPPRKLDSFSDAELQVYHHEAQAFWGVVGTEEDQMAAYHLQRDDQGVSFKSRATQELYTAKRRVNLVRNEQAKVRHEFYLHKPDSHKSVSLLMIEDARRKAEAEAEWADAKLRRLDALNATKNKYGYDLSNFEKMKASNEPMLPPEHLLFLAADTKKVDSKDIVKSDKASMDLRTQLAYRALQINQELTTMAVENKVIRSPRGKSLYQSSIKPLVNPQYHEEEAESSEDEEVQRMDRRERKIREKEKARAARDVIKDRRDAEVRAKELLDLAIYRRLKGDG